MEKQLNGVTSHDTIRQNLEQIRSFIQDELSEKKATIKNLKQEIEDLKEAISQKDETITSLKNNLTECRETAEGNRQLINKLLGDISRLQNDVDWYRRTYEKRSVLGTLKQKLFMRFTNKK